MGESVWDKIVCNAKDLAGKTIEQATETPHPSVLILRFTDGTACMISGDYDDDGNRLGIDMDIPREPEECLACGVIDRAEFDRRVAAKKAAEVSAREGRERAEYERLKRLYEAAGGPADG